VTKHPDFPHPLIAEIETYTGCVRYVNGGCLFCLEPREGKPLVGVTWASPPSGHVTPRARRRARGSLPLGNERSPGPA
jgi:hypothetical protein